MFTGIVAHCCPVIAVTVKPRLVQFSIRFPDSYLAGVVTGASIAVDGVCLTVVDIAGDEATFDAVEETLKRSTLGAIEVGRRVNVERSVRVGEEIGGHNVTGHVMGVADVVAVDNPENNHIITLRMPPAWVKYLIHKDFIALDGASLTIVDIDRSDSTFTVSLIPETLRTTTFGFKAVGDRVNFEIRDQTQVIIDTIERILPERIAASDH